MELVASLLLALSSLLGFTDLESTKPQTVEIGLAEVSPLGEAGGYAIPASGCASPHPHPGVVCGDAIWLDAEVENNLAINSGASLSSIQGAVANLGVTDANCHSYQIWINGVSVGSSGCTQIPIPTDGNYRIPNYPVSYTAPVVPADIAIDLRLCVDTNSPVANTSPASFRCDDEFISVIGTASPLGPGITANGRYNTEIINLGGTADIDWQPNGNTNCTLSAQLPGGVQTSNGSQMDNPTGQTTYTITCDEGAASVTVYVLPEFQET